MLPDDRLADSEAEQANEAALRADFQQAAWHETAAAHLTSPRRPALRGNRAFQACVWWKFAGRPKWAQSMARSFLADRCIPRSMKHALLQIARGKEVLPEHLGSFNTASAVIYWGFLAGCAWGVYKLGRYLITGSFGPKTSTRIPPAWEVHG